MGRGKGNPGRPFGTSKYPYRDDEERELIVNALGEGVPVPTLAARFGWPETEVRDLRAEYFPTTGLAHHYLRAKALRLAQRVVEEANVEEAVDILSRPNIGVLKPIEKNPARVGFFTSVSTDSLGGVQVRTALVSGPDPDTDMGTGPGPGTSTSTPPPPLAILTEGVSDAEIRSGRDARVETRSAPLGLLEGADCSQPQTSHRHRSVGAARAGKDQKAAQPARGTRRTRQKAGAVRQDTARTSHGDAGGRSHPDRQARVKGPTR